MTMPRRSEPADAGDRGDRLATFARADGEELRVSRDEFNGYHYLSLRIWFRGTDGVWRPTRKGVTIKARELRAVADAFARALALDEGSGS